MMMTRYRYKIYAAVFILLVAAMVLIAATSFNSGFVSSVQITVVANRAGLVMDPGAKVTYRGLEIGRVRAIADDGDRARLTLGVDPDFLHRIPENAKVSITSTTVFGAKYVSFEDPDPKVSTQQVNTLTQGAVINTDDVTVEINTAFERLTALVKQIDPDKLNETLGVLAATVGGDRGGAIGQVIVDAEEYLRILDEATPQLRQSIDAGAVTANAYADASPDIVGILRNVTTTAKTITDKQAQFDLLLTTTIGLAKTGSQFLEANGDPLITALRVLTPTTGLLSEYSPEFTCLIQGLDTVQREGSEALGGKYPGIHLDVGFLAGVPLYGNSGNLPKVAAQGGPRCFGLPDIGPDTKAPFLVTDTGVNQFGDEPSSTQFAPEDLLTVLIGNPKEGN